MVKKSKFLFKVNQNGTAKVYCGGKWHKDVSEVTMIAKPQDISVCITKYRVNDQGNYYTVNNAIPTEVKNYHFGNKG